MGIRDQQNIPHAMHLLKKAADAGNAYAHYSLGVLNLGKFQTLQCPVIREC